MAFRQLVFLVHGIGVHQKDWEQEFTTAINQAYDQYPNLKEVPIDERFEFVALGYDQIFRELVETWANNAAIITNLGADLGQPVTTKLVKWLQNAGELKNNPVWTHAVDALLYRGIRLVREHVCTKIAAKMIEAITAQHKEHGRSLWSVVAHSLGTAVVHDTLARVMAPNATWPGKIAFSAENEQANVVLMVANVSKLLEIKTADEPYDAYGRMENGLLTPTVAPGFAGQPGRICRYYLNARHKLDPITLPKMFAPQQWPDEAALKAVPSRYQFIEVDHLHQANTHDFGHYLKHPKVHVPLLRALVSPAHIPEPEYQQKLAAFAEFGPLGHDAAVKLRQKLLDILPAVSDDWLILGALWADIAKATGVKL